LKIGETEAFTSMTYSSRRGNTYRGRLLLSLHRDTKPSKKLEQRPYRVSLSEKVIGAMAAGDGGGDGSGSRSDAHICKQESTSPYLISPSPLLPPQLPPPPTNAYYLRAILPYCAEVPSSVFPATYFITITIGAREISTEAVNRAQVRRIQPLQDWHQSQ